MSVPVTLNDAHKLRDVLDCFVSREVPFMIFIDGERLKGWGGPDLGDGPVTLGFNEATYQGISRLPDGVFEPLDDKLVVSLSFDAVYVCRVPYAAILQISIMPSIPDTTLPFTHLRLVPANNRGEA